MRIFRTFSAMALCASVLSLAGCGSAGAGANSAAAPKKLYWIQGNKGHPVHQLTQIGFAEGCKKLGYQPVIVGSDGGDLGTMLGLAEQVLANGDAAGIALWAGNPALNTFIEKAGQAKVPVVLPHFPIPEGSVSGVTNVISCDPAAYAENAALEIAKVIGGKGIVAVTQSGFNITENLVSDTFRKTLNSKFPDIKVLSPEMEGIDLSEGSAKATSIIQANPGIVAAFSTTGGGASTWAKAQRDTGQKLVIIAMDYTRVNLDLVKKGEVYGVVGQPLWNESFGAAELLDQAVRGEKGPFWKKLDAPLITKDNLAPFEAIMDKVEAAVRK